ncbi:MAG: hypothetical protein C0484_09170 [Rhodospirillum sp.]|nr:hypothetical protein [Rhodospirillum sp.]
MYYRRNAKVKCWKLKDLGHAGLTGIEKQWHHPTMNHDPHQSRRFHEDLEANLQLAEELAPTHCAGCGGYHLARARRRPTSGTPDALDRDEMVRLLRAWAVDRPLSGTEPLEVVIVGSADTNLLAMAAEAVADLSPARYTVLDRCRTPLALCEAFARQHGLEIVTRPFDMGAPDEAFPADAIIVHSLLRFLPQSVHLAGMAAMKRWLKPGGTIVFSHRMMAADPGAPYYKSEYQTLAQLLRLFEAAGLKVAALQEAIEEGGPRHRILALLKSA